MNHRPLERNRKICPVYVCENKASQFYLLAGPTSPLGLQDPFANPEPTVCDVSFSPPPPPPNPSPEGLALYYSSYYKKPKCVCVRACLRTHVQMRKRGLHSQGVFPQESGGQMAIIIIII